MYVLQWRAVYAPTRALFWSLFPSCEAAREINVKNNSWASAQTVHHGSTYIILFLTRHDAAINDDQRTIFTHRHRASLVLFTFWHWRHNQRSKKTLKLRATGLCAGNSPGTGEFPAQMASDTENVSISWRHHVLSCYRLSATSVLPRWVTEGRWSTLKPHYWKCSGLPVLVSTHETESQTILWFHVECILNCKA